MISTHETYIHANGPEEVMVIVRELRAAGLVQGVDFDFRYQPMTTDPYDYSILIQKGASFYFNEAKWATFFRMKYGVA